MSLINKMLQDLDARGGANGAARLHPLPISKRRSPSMVMGLVGMALVLGVGGAIGFAAWKYFKRPAEPAKPAVTMLAAAAPPVKSVEPAKAPAPEASAPVVVEKVSAEAADDTAEETVQDAGVEKAAGAEVGDAAAKDGSAETGDDGATPALRPAAAPVKRSGEKTGRTISAGKPAAAPVPVRETTPQQKAEADYKRANASLQEGRITEAVATLERALQLDPRHEAARQTLVSLLIEARRGEEAIRVLQVGLTLEPNQPNMAMLLARLQIERGGPGIETLQRTLPYAEGNADYHAFLAGALQREQRHREAIEHYLAAVKGAPQSGVWLMGLGISLLAEKRNPEALDAFKRAKASGSLAPELQSYVERRIQQLSR